MFATISWKLEKTYPKSALMSPFVQIQSWNPYLKVNTKSVYNPCPECREHLFLISLLKLRWSIPIRDQYSKICNKTRIKKNKKWYHSSHLILNMTNFSHSYKICHLCYLDCSLSKKCPCHILLISWGFPLLKYFKVLFIPCQEASLPQNPDLMYLLD